MKISFKLIISFVLIAIFIGIVSAISINFSHESLSNSIGQSSSLVSSETIEHVDMEIYNRIEEFELLSKDSLVQQTVLFSNKEFETLGNVQEYIDKKDKEWVSSPKEEITPFMKQIIDNKLSDELRKSLMFFKEKYGYNVLGEIFITNAHGANVAQTGKTTDYKQDDEDWWIQAKDKGLYVRDVEFDESAGVYSTDIGIRVEDDTGNFIGVIKVILNVEEAINIIKEVEETTRYQNSLFTLLNGKGEVVYSTKGFELFEDVSNYPFYGKIQGNSGYFELDEGMQDENEKLFAYSRSEGYRDYKGLDWILILEHEKAEILKEANELRDSLLVISIGAVALAISMGILASRDISRPLIKLKKFTEKVAAGNMNESIESSGNDEIHDLTSSFNLMVKSLKKSKEELVATERKYRNLYERSPALHRTVNTDGIILDCNESYAKRFGYTKEEIIGSPIFKYVSVDNIPSLRKSFEKWKQHGTLSNRVVWFKTRDGSNFPALISASNVFDSNGKLIESNTIIREITDFYKTVKAEEEKANIQREMEEIKKVDKMKDEFTSMLSHELQTPLFPIKGTCEMLLDEDFSEPLSKAQRDLVQTIFSSSKRLDVLIKKLLLSQKLEMGKYVYNTENIDVKNFINKVFTEYSPVISQKQIDFIVSAKNHDVINAEENALHEVFDNLINNALDFIPKENGRIEIGAKSQNSSVVFFVKDNGVGISKEKQKHIFDKFYQTDASYTREHEGLGLGLSICKKLVNGMKGDIWLESENGNGSTFYFSLKKVGKK